MLIEINLSTFKVYNNDSIQYLFLLRNTVMPKSFQISLRYITPCPHLCSRLTKGLTSSGRTKFSVLGHNTNNKYQWPEETRDQARGWRLESSHTRTADTAGGQQQDDDCGPRREGGAAALRRRGGQPRARAPRGAARPPGSRRQAGAALQVGPEVRVAGAHCGGAGEVRRYLGDELPSCNVM